jgi:membrane protease YdiL (CAAX protease family)
MADNEWDWQGFMARYSLGVVSGANAPCRPGGWKRIESNRVTDADGTGKDRAVVTNPTQVGVVRSWSSLAVVRLLIGVVASLCVGSLVGAALGVEPGDRFSQFVISSLALHGAILFLVHLFLYEQGLSWSDAFGFRAEGAMWVLALAFGVTLAVLPSAWALGHVSALAMEWMRIEPVRQQAVTSLQSTVEVGPQIYMGTAAVLLIPVAEELLFRGVLYPWMKQGLGRRWALWSNAVLFGAVHFNMMTFLPLTLLGFILAWLYDRTRNLLGPIVVHSAFNLANLFLLALARIE